LLCFAPLWDDLYAGQINTFVLLALALVLLWGNRGSQVAAGAALAVAIVLKTSPALLLLYFVVRRQWRAIGAAAVGVVLLSAAAALVWRVEYLGTYVDVTLRAANSTFDYMNLSLQALCLRWCGEGGGAIVHKVVCVAALVFALRGPGVFARLVVVMTMASPLVWYHHLVYLLVPIVALLRTAPLAAWVAVALIQSERPLADHVPALAAVPTVLAAVVLYFARYGSGYDPATARDTSARPAS
jgi:alpha-1,2-mannosyltransferase